MSKLVNKSIFLVDRGIDIQILFTLILYRTIIFLLLNTTYVPDEYYQCMEPAFYKVYGFGIKTWEWSDENRIRSYVPLIPFILFFNMIKLMGLELFALSPRLLQMLLCINADYFLFKIAKRLIQKTDVAIYVLIAHLLSWFSSYCLSRTLANSFETSLLIIGSYFWSYSKTYRCNSLNMSIDSYSIAISIASVSTYCRPTCLFFWAAIVFITIIKHPKPLKFIFLKCLPIGLCVLQCCIYIDSWGYGIFTVSPINFYIANVFNNMSSLFGTNPWHWNFTNGIPVISGLYFPLFVYGLITFKQPRGINNLLLCCLIFTLSLSYFSSHQEHRFLLPCLPFIHLSVGFTAYNLIQSKNKRFWSILFIFIGITNFSAVLYLSVFHQGGTEPSLLFVRNDIMNNNYKSLTNIYLGAPCFTFPGYSFVYTEKYPVELFMPYCKPGESSKHFDYSPLTVIKNLIGDNNQTAVSYLLTFDSYLTNELNEFITNQSFTLIKTIRHSHFKYDYDDPYPKKFVFIFKR